MTNIHTSDKSLIYQINFAQLDKQYPGISKIQRNLKHICPKQLNILAQLIRYNVPRAYYKPEMLMLDELIQELYFQHIDRQIEQMQQQNELPVEITRKFTPISDQDQADFIIQAQQSSRQPLLKYSISDIRKFIQQFNPLTDVEKVNIQLKQSLLQLSENRKQKCQLQNYKNQQKDKQKAKNYNSNKKIQQCNNQASDKKYNKQIIITMGDKIPLEVKQMRNNVKKNSLDSFAVSSHKIEESKSQREKQKIIICLALNKVAKDNLISIYQDVEPLIKQNLELGQFLINQILNKCQNQPKMAQIYIEFICLFTKICSDKIKWQWNLKQKNQCNKNVKTNSIHRLLVQSLQLLFKNQIQKPQKSKNLKAICYLIGSLIRKRKISRKIYIEVSNKILSQIIKIKSQNLLEVIENYFQAIIRLIQSLNSIYDDIWGSQLLNELLTQENIGIAENLILQNDIWTIQNLMMKLAESFNFPTSRIKCLIQNLFSRKQTNVKPVQLIQTQAKNNTNEVPLPSEIIHQLLSQNKIDELLQKYQQSRSSQNLSKILLTIFNGNHQQVKNNTKIFLNNFIPIIKMQQFEKFWEQNYLTFVFEQCDLPYMIESLANIFLQYFGQDSVKLIIKPEEDNEDIDDINHFMLKLRNFL